MRIECEYHLTKRRFLLIGLFDTTREYRKECAGGNPKRVASYYEPTRASRRSGKLGLMAFSIPKISYRVIAHEFSHLSNYMSRHYSDEETAHVVGQLQAYFVKDYKSNRRLKIMDDD